MKNKISNSDDQVSINSDNYLINRPPKIITDQERINKSLENLRENIDQSFSKVYIKNVANNLKKRVL
jgi:hypothetical protein